jgi:hypothetical protein
MDNDTIPPTGVASPQGGRALVLLSSLVLAVLGITAGVVVTRAMSMNATASAAAHRERMDPQLRESDISPEDLALPAGAQPVRVQAGIYLDRIPELSVRDASWTADFYIWFRWKNADISPGENFLVVDGWIEQRQKVEAFVDGDEHFERYRVVAKISKFFDVRRFPLDNHLLTINIEYPAYRRAELLFVADPASSISSRAQVSAYRIGRAQIVEKPHAYSSTMGDPRLPTGYRGVQSQLRLGIPLGREGWAFFFKLFQGTFASMAVAMIIFFIRPTNLDPRFGLGVGAFFAAIASTYVTSSLIPDTGIMTLADIVNGLAMATIFLTMVQSALSLHLHEERGDRELSRDFDRWSFWVFAIGVIVLNVVIPLSALP